MNRALSRTRITLRHLTHTTLSTYTPVAPTRFVHTDAAYWKMNAEVSVERLKSNIQPAAFAKTMVEVINSYKNANDIQNVLQYTQEYLIMTPIKNMQKYVDLDALDDMKLLRVQALFYSLAQPDGKKNISKTCSKAIAMLGEILNKRYSQLKQGTIKEQDFEHLVSSLYYLIFFGSAFGEANLDQQEIVTIAQQYIGKATVGTPLYECAERFPQSERMVLAESILRAKYDKILQVKPSLKTKELEQITKVEMSILQTLSGLYNEEMRYVESNDFMEKLFKIAKQEFADKKVKLASYQSDYGRTLLLCGKVAEAQEQLEQAILSLGEKTQQFFDKNPVYETKLSNAIVDIARIRCDPDYSSLEQADMYDESIDMLQNASLVLQRLFGQRSQFHIEVMYTIARTHDFNMAFHSDPAVREARMREADLMYERIEDLLNTVTDATDALLQIRLNTTENTIWEDVFDDQDPQQIVQLGMQQVVPAMAVHSIHLGDRYLQLYDDSTRAIYYYKRALQLFAESTLVPKYKLCYEREYAQYGLIQALIRDKQFDEAEIHRTNILDRIEKNVSQGALLEHWTEILNRLFEYEKYALPSDNSTIEADLAQKELEKIEKKWNDHLQNLKKQDELRIDLEKKVSVQYGKKMDPETAKSLHKDILHSEATTRTDNELILLERLAKEKVDKALIKYLQEQERQNATQEDDGETDIGKKSIPTDLLAKMARAVHRKKKSKR